jgi:hypothetical protein
LVLQKSRWAAARRRRRWLWLRRLIWLPVLCGWRWSMDGSFRPAARTVRGALDPGHLVGCAARRIPIGERLMV